MQEQLATNTYDLLSNLALLKLYQFNPSLLSPSAVLSVLLISLAHAPFSPDFNLAWSLLSDSFVVGADLPPPAPGSDDDDDDEPAARGPAEPHGERDTADELNKLSTLLASRKFKAFWATLREKAKEESHVGETIAGLLSRSEGFEKTLRGNIAFEVEASFKGISKATLASFLGLDCTSLSFTLPTFSHSSSDITYSIIIRHL